ncbi:hypothetical protein G0U57_007335, partial [Chelydra serpentina]
NFSPPALWGETVLGGGEITPLPLTAGPAGSDSGSEPASFSGISEAGGLRQLLPAIRGWSLAAVGGSDQRCPQMDLPSSALPWLPGRMVGSRTEPKGLSTCTAASLQHIW